MKKNKKLDLFDIVMLTMLIPLWGAVICCWIAAFTEVWYWAIIGAMYTPSTLGFTLLVIDNIGDN